MTDAVIITKQEETFLLLKYGSKDLLADAYCNWVDLQSHIVYEHLTKHEREDLMLNFFAAELT